MWGCACSVNDMPTRTSPKIIRTMPMSLRQFSEQLGRGTAVHDAVVARCIASRDIAIVEPSKKSAHAWLKSYVELRGVETTGSKVFAPVTVKPVAPHRKVNADEVKRYDPALWERCRAPKPYRKITPPRGVVERVIEIEPAVVVPAWSSDRITREVTKWPITRRGAQEAYETLSAQCRALLDTRDASDEVIDSALLPHVSNGDWDGIVPLRFNDGYQISLRQIRFDQELALELVPRKLGDRASTFIIDVPETPRAPQYRLLSRAGYLQSQEGDLEPFEGD